MIRIIEKHKLCGQHYNNDVQGNDGFRRGDNDHYRYDNDYIDGLAAVAADDDQSKPIETITN